jgi:uncharacterized Zn finger protein
VSIGVKVLSPRQWEHLLEVLAGQALFVAKLLAGEMPQDIEDVFARARLSLFPQKRGDLKTDCSCLDDANPCKHIAAVYYLLGEEFDPGRTQARSASEVAARARSRRRYKDERGSG